MKVILVTHSMGGLVARALTQLHGYERVLGWYMAYNLRRVPQPSTIICAVAMKVSHRSCWDEMPVK